MKNNHFDTSTGVANIADSDRHDCYVPKHLSGKELFTKAQMRAKKVITSTPQGDDPFYNMYMKESEEA